MIPDNRLATLLDHVKQNQINQCLYHNTAQSPSLYSDHMCDRDDFPLGTKLELNKHTDEVWHCQFSHDGTKLVTAGRDSNVIIYDTSTFSVLYILGEHKNGVAHAVWSPDDTKLITCSRDSTARVWSTEVCSKLDLFTLSKLTKTDRKMSPHYQQTPRASDRSRLGS
jgi:WD40 repeat protein